MKYQALAIALLAVLFMTWWLYRRPVVKYCDQKPTPEWCIRYHGK